MGLLGKSKPKAADPTKKDGDVPLGGAGRPTVPLTRKLSVISQKTVETLEGREEQLDSMKLHCDEAEHDLNNPDADGFREGLRGDLATMHGERTASQLPAAQRPLKLVAALPSSLLSIRQSHSGRQRQPTARHAPRRHPHVGSHVWARRSAGQAQGAHRAVGGTHRQVRGARQAVRLGEGCCRGSEAWA